MWPVERTGMSINCGCQFQSGKLVICKRKDVWAHRDGEFHSSARRGTRRRRWHSLLWTVTELQSFYCVLPLIFTTVNSNTPLLFLHVKKIEGNADQNYQSIVAARTFLRTDMHQLDVTLSRLRPTEGCRRGKCRPPPDAALTNLFNEKLIFTPSLSSIFLFIFWWIKPAVPQDC